MYYILVRNNCITIYKVGTIDYLNVKTCVKFRKNILYYY